MILAIPGERHLRQIGGSYGRCPFLIQLVGSLVESGQEGAGAVA